MYDFKHRTIMILDLLAVHKTVKLSMLSEALNISHVTLRKDLDNLESRGIIKCTHGYASLDGADNTCKRMAFCYLIKQRIAKAAVQIVEEGETIMLESGSCCALFAEELALAHKNNTIITNSVFITNYIRKIPTIKIVLLGGYYQAESQVLVGPVTINEAEHFFPDKYFFGSDGFISGKGFTGRDYLRTETILGLTQYANKSIVLTEAAKFDHYGSFVMIGLDNIFGVFTDDSIPKEAEDELNKYNIKLYKVSAAGEN